ncbi:MAG TPA: DUF2231 domain-containing protein [Vicinamibacterales bacterium]|nr:DUF2231 domain-containing protein [Vicinamibacterales bacterium]
MAVLARFHPLLVHFPIALVIVAAAAEAGALLTGDRRWRAIAVANVCAGAPAAVISAVAGWLLASTLGLDPTSILVWHRWLGAAGAGVTVVAALATVAVRRESSRGLWVYRIALVLATLLIAVAGHLGGLMVWGADFLNPE